MRLLFKLFFNYYHYYFEFFNVCPASTRVTKVIGGTARVKSLLTNFQGFLNIGENNKKSNKNKRQKHKIYVIHYLENVRFLFFSLMIFF